MNLFAARWWYSHRAVPILKNVGGLRRRDKVAVQTLESDVIGLPDKTVRGVGHALRQGKPQHLSGGVRRDGVILHVAGAKRIVPARQFDVNFTLIVRTVVAISE